MLTPSIPQFHKRRARAKAKSLAPPTPPGPPVVVIQAVLAGDHTADWVFDSNIVEVIDLAPLHINGASPDALVFLETNVMRVSYEIAIDIGDPWTYDGTQVATFANGGTLQPASGTTQEG